MNESLDNLLVEAFSKSLFKDSNKDVEDGQIDKEEGEIDSSEENRYKHRKSKMSKLKTKHRSKLKSKSKIDSKLKKLKKLSKSESMVRLASKANVAKITSRINSKMISTTKSKSGSMAKSKIRSKISSKFGSKSAPKSGLKSSSKIKKSKTSDKSVKPKDKYSDENESEVMKLLLSKQLRSYADIQFKDEELSPEKDIPKKSKHKSKHSDKSKRHKKSKYSDEYYEKQKDSYYSSHSSQQHEDYFYGSYYEGTSTERSRDWCQYSRPLSPFNDNESKHSSRSRSPIEYDDSHHRRRSVSPTERYHRIRDRERRSMTPFYKDGHTDIRDHRRSLSPGGRSCRSGSVASSVSRVNKQQLLEIARNNLIKMIEKGDLPKGTDVSNLDLKQLRELTTQKPVQQWTEFCRAISTLDSTAWDTDLDSDSDNDDIKSVASDQPFTIRHPFNVNERKDRQIQMSIRGFPQLPSRSAKELAIELREQFPVSSGDQHRRKEITWREVEVMPPPALPAPKRAKKIETKLTEILNTPKSIPDPQIAYKFILPTTATTATTSTTTSTIISTITSTTISSDPQQLTTTITAVSPDPITTPTSTITDPAATPQPVPPPDPFDPCSILALPTTATSESEPNSDSNVGQTDSVFPQSSMKIDIGSVMAQRLSAMRKLQEDPHNVVALKQMYQANQMMTEWAESKIVPGQFIGSTGANILTPEQLTGSYNAWTRKDQLKTAAPITEGIGMLLLLKMGWTPGKGLGKNNEGSIHPIMLEIKNDKKGLVAEEEKVRNLPLQLVSTTPVGNNMFLSKPGKNPVSILHELCAKKKWNQPDYQLVNEVGPDHRKNFTFKVLLNGVEYQPSVSSANKKQAKALAAGVCLQAFGLLPKDNA